MAWSNQTKNSATFSNDSLNSATFDTGLYFLLTELSTYLLQENGGRIVLSQSTGYIPALSWGAETLNSADFSNQSPNSASWSNQAKN